MSSAAGSSTTNYNYDFDAPDTEPIVRSRNREDDSDESSDGDHSSDDDYEPHSDPELESESESDSSDPGMDLDNAPATPRRENASRAREYRTRNWARTAHLLGSGQFGPLDTRVADVLMYMTRRNLDLTSFLDALLWGDEGCTMNKQIASARGVLMQSEQFPGILERLMDPRRPVESGSARKRRRYKGARTVMESFVVRSSQKVFSTELEGIAPMLTTETDNDEDVDVDALTETNLSVLADTIATHAPNLWTTLECLTAPFRVRTNKRDKDTRTPILIIFSILSYIRSRNRNKVQKMLSIYFKFQGTSAKGQDVLHRSGYIMSHRWGAKSIARMGGNAQEEMKTAMKLYAWFASHDNMQLARTVFEQRIDNKGEFFNGTAATLFTKQDVSRLTEKDNQELQLSRRISFSDPISLAKITELAYDAQLKIDIHACAFVLREVLVDSAEFDKATYSGKDDPLLQPPDPIHRLPSGPGHEARQFVFGSMNIAEDSYEGNRQLLEEWLRQLGIISKDEKKKFSVEEILILCGDQLTIERLRGLARYRADDDTAYDRYDWLIYVFGWFHLIMCFASSLYRQYLGDEKSNTLRAAFILLQRKGLNTVSIKGPFHHHLHEAILHYALARFRVDWMKAAGVDSLEELRNKSPSELVHLAEKVVNEYASQSALDSMSQSEEHMDEKRAQVTMWNRDVLIYLILCDAVRRGDIGMMEALLPTLLTRFIGGRNTKYALEVIELLQGLHKEWPPGVADFIRQNCWVINFTARSNAFHPIDLAQEHNIRDLKDTYRSQGAAGNKWEYYRVLHPAIPVVRDVIYHVDSQFKTLGRGKAHTSPSKDKDVLELQKMFLRSGYHNYVPGRKLDKESALIANFMDIGEDYLFKGSFWSGWNERRQLYVRREGEDSDSDASESAN